MIGPTALQPSGAWPRSLEPAVLGLPVVEARLADPVLAARSAVFIPASCSSGSNDLLFRMPLALHWSFPSNGQNSHMPLNWNFPAMIGQETGSRSFLAATSLISQSTQSELSGKERFCIALRSTTFHSPQPGQSKKRLSIEPLF